MKLIAEGCENCEPRVAPGGPRENDDHIGVRFPETCWGKDCVVEVVLDGVSVPDVCEAWVGSPGRVIRYQADGKPVRMCSCTPIYRDNEDGTQNDPKPFRQLIEYDKVEVRRVPYPLTLAG